MARQHYSDNASEDEKKSFQNYLAEDEELVLVTGLSPAYLRQIFILRLFWPGVVLVILGLVGAYLTQYNLGYGLLVGLAAALFLAFLLTQFVMHANRYLLTTRRVIIKRGILSVKLTSALYDKITHIEVEQSLFDKLLLHHGNIIVNTAGMNKGEIILKYVDWPIELKNLLERLINREREHTGMRTGSISTIEGELVDD
ncbi:PH domain-containing protein [Candidatus Daviesbacteria bacterium]|nr:PH domain-containing protein [Candidatus Daviesbacteria bacterium]